MQSWKVRLPLAARVKWAIAPGAADVLFPSDATYTELPSADTSIACASSIGWARQSVHWQPVAGGGCVQLGSPPPKQPECERPPVVASRAMTSMPPPPAV